MKKGVNVHSVVRLAIQIVFFVFLPSLFSAAFNGVKYIAGQIQRHEMIEWNPFLATLVVLLVFTAVFGRFFCGYACAFGSFGDWLFACSSFARKKAGKKAFKLPDRVTSVSLYLKYLVLSGIITACLLDVYPLVGRADPWEAFAVFRAGDFSLDGRGWMAVAFGLIAVGMLLVERFFCMFLCPLGAVFALLPMLPFTIYGRKREECIPGCSLCVRTCPASISLGGEHSRYGDCFQCGRCAVSCPKGNVRLGFRRLKGTEAWLAALKASVLFAVCYPVVN
jgi:polyferredoxin